MAQQGYSSNTPLNPDGTIRDWSHRNSRISDDPYVTAGTIPSGHGRESMVSLDSHRGSLRSGSVSESTGHVYSRAETPSWSAPFRPLSGQYELVPAKTISSDRSQPIRGMSRDALMEDEDYDMSLLRSAAPFGASTAYSAALEDNIPEPSTPIFDMSSFSGPMGAQDQEFLRNVQEQEANGRLTGGLGTGMSPDTRIKSDELLATSPTINRSLSRALSARRKPTVRNEIRGLGQTAANRTGEVIEVIMEEPSDIDLSNMTGPAPIGIGGPDQMRRSTFPRSDFKTEVFYPQPDWKPFSMRWPYLLSLIIISLGLAIGQELLYHQSTIAPLMRFQNPDEIKPFDYFVLKFLPTIVTVTFGILWSITDFEVKRLEAFYQMSKEGGALAAESINVDYLTTFNLMKPIRAFHRKHYAVAISSITSLLAVSLVPTLGSAAIVLNPDKTTRHTDVLTEKTITISPVLSRLLTSSFVIVAVLGTILLYQLQSRRSGLLADVKGIAGLASMAVVSHIMMDFKDMDTTKPKDIHHRLKNHRYVLRNSSLARDDSSPLTSQERDRSNEVHLSENPHPLMLRAEGGIPFMVGILLFLGFIPLFLFTPVSELTDRVPWVVTALAVCIKLGWGVLETDLRTMEPYYILSKRHAPARTLTLDYTAMPFAWVAIRALLNKHWLVFLVGFGTVLSETLTIFATSLATVEGKDFIDQIRHAANDSDGTFFGSPSPDNPNQDSDFNTGQETVLSFVVSLAFTTFILLYMFTVATLVFLRRRHPFLPRQPNTIASILTFMHQSKMLYDFVGTAKFSDAEKVRRLESLGKTYGLGWFEGRDGQTHCGVEEEELIGSYKHGINYSQVNKPWDRDWQLF